MDVLIHFSRIFQYAFIGLPLLLAIDQRHTLHISINKALHVLVFFKESL